MWTRFSLAALTVLPLCAQTNTGTITGLVTDPAGAAVAGAKVIVRNQATGAAVNTATTEAGNYAAPSLPAGIYDIAVIAAGFKRAAAASVEVHSTQTTTK